MKRPVATLGAILLIGCSDATAPNPGTFRARLTGARVATLSGESNGSFFYSVEYPDARFAMRMFAVSGGEVQAIVLHCPGQNPPTPGTYAVSASVSDCGGSYSRVRNTEQGGITVLEQAVAASGSLTISSSTGPEVIGSFSFQGTLMVGSESEGSLAASGSFSATAVP